jgi:hypothetical protein
MDIDWLWTECRNYCLGWGWGAVVCNMPISAQQMKPYRHNYPLYGTDREQICLGHATQVLLLKATLTSIDCVQISAAEPHHFYVAPVSVYGKIFMRSRRVPAPALYNCFQNCWKGHKNGKLFFLFILYDLNCCRCEFKGGLNYFILGNFLILYLSMFTTRFGAGAGPHRVKVLTLPLHGW